MIKSAWLIVAVIAISLIFVINVGAISVDTGTGINETTEQFVPKVWMCFSRTLVDDATEPGRISPGGTILTERINNYAFEGEQILFSVLVMDKNGIDKLKDVYVSLGQDQGTGNNVEANCYRESFSPVDLPKSCNSKILEENLTRFDNETMAFYDCVLTVETPESMYGEYWTTVEAEDLSGLKGNTDEKEFWFLNPVITLSIQGDLTFDHVRPGTSGYSKTLLIGNDADTGSGVMLDMFISGTDFYDSASSGAKCPVTNQLNLTAFSYYAVNGAYSTSDPYGPSYIGPDKDAEGYKGIVYGIGFNNPDPFYDHAEIIPVQQIGPYYVANILAPGAEMAVTFRLNMPEPCNGNYDTGNIYFWGEAI